MSLLDEFNDQDDVRLFDEIYGVGQWKPPGELGPGAGHVSGAGAVARSCSKAATGSSPKHVDPADHRDHDVPAQR